MRPICGASDPNLSFTPCTTLVFDRKPFNERICGLSLDEVDRAAAETSACKPCPQAARQLAGDLDQGIQFGGTDLIEIAQAGVSLEH